MILKKDISAYQNLKHTVNLLKAMSFRYALYLLFHTTVMVTDLASVRDFTINS